jgi:hypothetical protein
MDSSVDKWSGFFQSLSGVSATLLGISFVAFQFRHQSWAQDKLRHPIAVLSLVELAAPVFFSLMLLFPVPLWSQWGWFPDTPGYVAAGWLVGLGGYSVLVWQAWAYFHDSDRKAFDRWQFRGSIVPVITFGVMLFPFGLEWKAAVSIWMTLSGITEAWMYLGTPERSLTGPTNSSSDATHGS